MQINNIQDTYYLITAISAVVVLILGFLLASIHLPKDLPSQKFNTARIYLSASYSILGLAGLLTCIFPVESDNPFLLLFITSFVASLQSLLFTATYIVFIQPERIQKKYIVGNLLSIIIITLLLYIVYELQVININLMTGAVLFCYISQQIYYVLAFRHLYNQCVMQMEEYYDEEQSARLRSVNYSFYAALCIGIMSIVASITGLFVYVVFIVLYTMFYTYMVVLVYNNKLITRVIHPAVVKLQTEPLTAYNSVPRSEADVEANTKPQVEPQTLSEQEEPKESVKEASDSANEEELNRQFKEKLEKWISDKGYMQKDLSVDDIADTFNISRDYLRYFFRTYVHTDFRTWRASLRVKEAKKLMIQYPEYNFSKISEMVGFNHRANFFNQFVKLEGMTPSEWREKQCKE